MNDSKIYTNYGFFKKIRRRKNQDSSWNEKFEFLHIFKEIYGHTNVPQRFYGDPGLGSWVGKQRGYFSKSKLSRNRVELLHFLNFEWAPGKGFSFDAAWNKRYEELKYFLFIYGHTNVPCEYKNNRELGYWVKNQRQFKRKKFLDDNRIFLLNILGFEWIRREPTKKLSWLERYKEYENYMAYYGNGLVPQRSGPLGKWVQKQRDLFRKNLIKNERKEILNSLNFIWEPKKKRIKHLQENPGNGENYQVEDFFFFQGQKNNSIFSLF